MKEDDAISRQTVLDYIYNDLGLGDEEYGKDAERLMELERSYKYIKSLSPVTPQPKTGYWILTIEDWNKWTCSECGFSKRTDIHVTLGYHFCPKCGAKMVETQESEEQA